MAFLSAFSFFTPAVLVLLTGAVNYNRHINTYTSDFQDTL